MHPSVFSQDRKELEQIRNGLNAKIESLNDKLKSLESNKSTQISRYNTLEAQTDSRKKLIETIQAEISLIDKDLGNKTTELDVLQKDLDVMVDDYAQLLRIDYLDRLKRNNNFSLLNSNNLVEAITKWKYLKQFESFITNKLNSISSASKNVEEKDLAILATKKQKEVLLKTEEDNLQLMEAEIEELNQSIKSDLSQQKEIKTEIQNYSSSREKLNKKIENALFNSFSNNTYTSSTSEKDFEYRKGFMSWPVQKKSLSLRYGEQYHPIHKNVKINNSGIDIISQSNIVSSITHGIVSSVVSISESKTTIILKHDNDYYSVYSNLKNIYVSKNDKVNSDQAIGEMALNDDNTYDMHFEIWKGKENLNPTNWLKNN